MNTKSIKNKKIVKGIKKLQKAAAVSCTTATLMLSSTLTTFAANVENSAPAGVQTSTMNSLIGILMWAVRIILIFFGVVGGLLKIGHGAQAEDNRERNTGFITLGIIAVCFAGTFALEALM